MKLISRIKNLKPWKYKRFLLPNALFVLLMLFLLIRIFQPSHIYEFTGSRYFFIGEGADAEIIYRDIRLPAGMYEIALQYQTAYDTCGICSVEDPSVFSGGLLAGYEHFYAARTVSSYPIWLFTSTDTLAVNVTLSADADLTTGNLTIRETNGLWSMLLTILLFLASLWNLAVLFALYDKAYGIAKEKKAVLLFVTFVALLSGTPFFPDGIITGADLGYHLHRLEAVPAGISSGQFPIRIAPRWLYGQGYADPVFYCDLLLIIPGLMRLLGFPLTLSYRIFGVLVNFATAWISYYVFFRIFRDRRIGAACCLFYTLSVFRLYKFVIAGALGEGTAQIFLPLILLGLYEALAENEGDDPNPSASLHLTLGYAGLFQTHVLTTEITVFLTLLLCLIYVRRVLKPGTFAALLKGALGSVLLSLWYLLPFLDYYLTQDVHIKHVSARTIQCHGLYLGELFYLFPRLPQVLPEAYDGMINRQPGGGHAILTFALLLFFALWYSGKITKKDPLTRFAKICSCLAGLLALCSLQIFPWDVLQEKSSLGATLISSLQFPNRFLGWGSCLMILILGYLFLHYREIRSSLGQWLLFGTSLLFLVSSCCFLYLINRDCPRSCVYSEEMIDFGYISGAEYVIEGTPFTELTFEEPVADPSVTLRSYQKQGLRIRANCVNASQEAAYVDFPLLLYKGYQAKDVQTGELLPLSFSDKKQLRVQLPGGYNGELDIRFVSPFYWRIAELISLLTLLGICFRNRKSKERRPVHEK